MLPLRLRGEPPPTAETKFVSFRVHCQKFLSTYRYQLANMAYALGLAHHYRLRGAPRDRDR
jgi:hypothetical protein